MPLLLLFLTFLSQCTPVQQDHQLQGQVVRIADGDTLTILDSLNQTTKIRLYGIDCPESGQDFSQVAKRFTTAHCAQKSVRVTIKDVDQYGRTVGIVYLEDGTELNLALLQAGLAWHYTAFDHSARYAHAEAQAREQKKGLWVQGNAQPPWKYRQSKRSGYRH